MHSLTRSCFLLLVLWRLFLLALPFLLGICLRSRWSLPFPLHAPALIPLFLAKVRLSPILTLSPFMIWYYGQTALFLFLLARAAPAYLPTALSVALRPLFHFRQAQYVPVFPLKPAPFCTLFAGLGNTNKFAIFLLFSSCLTLALSSPPCPLLHLFFYLKLCGRSGRNCLLSPSVLLNYNGSPDIGFSWGTTRLMGWPDGVCYLRLPQSLVVSLLLSLVSTLVLSRTGGVLSHQNFLTHRFPRFPPRNLCSLVMLAVSSLVFAATDTAFCWVLISLGLAESRILPAAPVDTRPRTPLISFCTVQLRTLCAAHSLSTLYLSIYDLWSRPWGVSRLLGSHGVPSCPHPSEGVG